MHELTDDRGLIKNPKDWKDWQSRPDRKEFEAAGKTEMLTIAKRHVMTLPLTAVERQKMGVKSMKPVPIMKIWETYKTRSSL